MRRDVVACVLAAAMLAAGASGAADAGAPAADAGTASPPNPHHGADAAESPHGQGAGAGKEDRLPQDGAMEDPSVPLGSISAHVADGTGRPLPKTEVTLGILYNSVAKGENRKRVTRTSDEQGRVVFDGLDSGTGVAYRVMVLTEGATFAVAPFQLPAKSGMRALLHVYPVSSKLEDARVFSQTIVYVEVKDDRIQVQEAFRIGNFSGTAWVPTDFVVPLPPTFTAFTTQQGMTDIGVDAVPGKGVKLHGTFGPGEHMVEFRWQLPYSGDAEVRLDVGASPNAVNARVISPASKDMTLDVPGFPTPQATNDAMGQRALITEKRMTAEDPPISKLSVVIRGLPTVGPGRIYATLLAAAGIVIGLVFGTSRPRKSDRKAERAKVLAEIEALERARERGDVGPKTYEKARSDLLQDLARIIATEAKPKSAKPSRRKAVA